MTIAIPDARPTEAAPPAVGSSLIRLVREELEPAWRAEAERLEIIDAWWRWKAPLPPRKKGSDPELGYLLELARTPWLRKVVATVAQLLRVEGYTAPADDDGPEGGLAGWRAFVRNGLEARQGGIHTAALTYGYTYGIALPGVDRLTGSEAAVLRGASPRRAWAAYDDAAEDDWPQHFLRVSTLGPTSRQRLLFRVLDDAEEHRIVRDGSDWTYLGSEVHNLGVCPVVRWCNDLDLEGRTPGEVEPNIDVARRINKTSFDRLLVQHFNSWKVRTATGLEEPADENDAEQTKTRLRVQDILVGEPGVEFGSLPETPLDGFIRAWESDIEALAAVSQTPAHNLTGKMVNLSAEALAAAESETQRKVADRKLSFGVTWSQLLRLSAYIEGDDAGAADFTARVAWADVESRSLAQAVDAWGKAATMLQIPPQALWGRIPGVTRSDVEDWKALVESGDEFGAYLRDLAAKAADAAGGQSDQDPAAQQDTP